MRVSKDPDDYQYLPPAERRQRVVRALRIGLQIAGVTGGVVLLLSALHVG
jgi:hypothetical protein